MRKIIWVRVSASNRRPWHAWPKGGQSSMCGTLTATKLHTTPLRSVTHTLPEGAVVCRLCVRALGPGTVLTSPAKGHRPLDKQTEGWLITLNAHLARYHLIVAAPLRLELAKRLASIGPTTDAHAVDVYEQIRELLLTPRLHRRDSGKGGGMKIVGLRDALKALPPDARSLNQVAASMKMWRHITQRSVDKGERFHVDTVITAMLEVPAPEPYIRHLHGRGLSSLAVMFHPNTLKARSKDAALRGVFGGTKDYWARTAAQLATQVVKD